MLDRQALGARVFGNKEALRRLEAIVHPLVGQRQRAFLKRAARRGEKLVVLDIPLLFEGLGERRVDATLVVSAPAFLQRHRVMARPGMTAERLDGILRQQVPDVAEAAQGRRSSSRPGWGWRRRGPALARAVRELKTRRGRFWPPNPVAREIHSPACAGAPQVGYEEFDARDRPRHRDHRPRSAGRPSRGRGGLHRAGQHGGHRQDLPRLLQSRNDHADRRAGHARPQRRVPGRQAAVRRRRSRSSWSSSATPSW